MKERFCGILYWIQWPQNRVLRQSSGAVAVVVRIVDDYQIEYIIQNGGNFIDGENVIFEESRILGNIQSTSSISSDISFNFTYQTGQKETFYDYGILTRKPESQEPTKKLKIYFSSAYYDSSDTGDITTKESYNAFDYTYDIKSVNSSRTTDIIDIRPRVNTI